MQRHPQSCQQGAQTGAVTPRDAGFTLLEVLVAFIIVSLALVALLDGGAAGLRGAAAAGRVEDAVALARSHLSSFDALAAPTAEDLQGDEGNGFHWRLRVAPLDSLTATALGRTRRDPAALTQTTLYQVSVIVSWRAGRQQSSVRLDTQRLTPMPPQLP